MRTPIIDLFRPGVHAVCRLYFGLELRGIEHIPSEGGVVIAPNHQTFADPPLVTIPVRRPVHYMAWDRLFRVPVLGWSIRRLRAFPVDIEASDSRATRAMIRLLQSGAAVMIFPEGGRTLDGRLAPFKIGAFRLAASQRVPVLPVTIVGGHDAWPPGRTWPKPGRITITYHAPIVADRTKPPREAARDLLDRVRATIASALPRDDDRVDAPPVVNKLP